MKNTWRPGLVVQTSLGNLQHSPYLLANAEGLAGPT